MAPDMTAGEEILRIAYGEPAGSVLKVTEYGPHFAPYRSYPWGTKVWLTTSRAPAQVLYVRDDAIRRHPSSDIALTRTL